MDLKNAATKELLNNCLSRFQSQYYVYNKMYAYYCGVTDTSRNIGEEGLYNDPIINDLVGTNDCTSVNDRSTKRVDTNFIKKFVKEEVAYSVGNPITFVSMSNDPEILKVLNYEMAHWKVDHESNLAKQMLTFSTAYELYYTDGDNQFCSKVISPRHGFAYKDDDGNILFFLHVFKRDFDTKTYIDIHTNTEIIHCDENFNEILGAKREVKLFGGYMSVGEAEVSEEGWLDTLYHDIKTLQDAFCNTLSDATQEMSEFRNAYLAFKNAQVNEDDLPEMKKNGIIQFKGDGSAEWLTKDINPAFIMNTLSTIEDKIYQLSCHLNNNQQMVSNTSSLAMRAKLISLEQKTILNEKALTNCIKTRLKVLFAYINGLRGTKYDYKDIKIKFTSCIPSDDYQNAQIVNLLGDKISNQTARTLFSFINDPLNEEEKIKQEHDAELPDLDLNTVTSDVVTGE